MVDQGRHDALGENRGRLCERPLASARTAAGRPDRLTASGHHDPNRSE